MEQNNLSAPPDLLAGEQLPPAPQQDRSRRKREALLLAGMALFAEKGYEASGIDEIAALAGVAAGGFYQHFVNKRQLLLVLMNQLLHEADALTRPESIPQLAPRQAIAALVTIGIEVDQAFAGAYRAWREAATRDAEIRTLDATLMAWFTARMHQLFGALHALPGARPEADLATLATIFNLLFFRLIESLPDDAAQRAVIAEAVTGMIYHALFVDELAEPQNHLTAEPLR